MSLRAGGTSIEREGGMVVDEHSATKNLESKDDKGGMKVKVVEENCTTQRRRGRRVG